jgi:hypothetical protein
MIDPTFKAAWIAKLRDPSTKQGRGYLERADGSQCCLGVAANLKGVPKELDDEVYAFHFEGSTTRGMPSPDWEGLTAAQQDILAGMNDIGRSFSEIADWIEANL